MTNDNDTLQSLLQHRIKLSKLQAKLEEINNSIEEKIKSFSHKNNSYTQWHQAELLPLLS